jgi:hypothetical protein
MEGIRGNGTPETATILANVEWIVARLDSRGLAEIDDVPVLELAKHISVGGLPA